MQETKLEALKFVIATDTGAEVVEGFTLPKSPLAIHHEPETGWVLTLRDGGLAVIREMTETQAHYAIKVLSPMPWIAPYEVEGQHVYHLRSSFAVERARGKVTDADVVRYLIRRLRDDDRLHDICGPLTEMWELVVGAVATTEGCCHADAEERLKKRVGKRGRSKKTIDTDILPY